MKRVFQSATLTEVHFVKGILEREGIQTVIRNEHIAGLAGEVPFIEVWPEIWVVDERQINQAETLIAEYQKDKPFLEEI